MTEVNCMEVENYLQDRGLILRTGDTHNAVAYADALARLVAKYKWERDEATGDHAVLPESMDDAIADLDRRWNELHS